MSNKSPAKTGVFENFFKLLSEFQMIIPDTGRDNLARLVRAAHLIDNGFLALETLVMLEEMLHFIKDMLRKLADVLEIPEIRIG